MIERSKVIQVVLPQLQWDLPTGGLALPQPAKLAGAITLAHGLSQIFLMAAFHGWDGFALAIVAIDAVIGVALLRGSTTAEAWLRFRVAAGFLLFAPAILLAGDFAGLVAMLALWTGQFALVTPEFRKTVGSGQAAGLAAAGLVGGFGLCVAHGLGIYAPTALV